MKILILVALFALASAKDFRKATVFNRPCSERSALIRPQAKEAFNVAAVSSS